MRHNIPFKIFAILAIITLYITQNNCLATSPQCENNRYISFPELQKSLPSKPINVGFDVDFTVIDPTPCAMHAFIDNQGNETKHEKNILQDERFWDSCNKDLVHLSSPKHIGKRLLDMHRERGDKIHFITARVKTKGENLTAYLNNIFGLNNVKVHFTGLLNEWQTNNTSKSKILKDLKINLYYGDSDGDMKDAQTRMQDRSEYYLIAHTYHIALLQRCLKSKEIVECSVKRF